MLRFAKIFLLGAALFGFALVARLLFVPDIQPIASEDKAQPLWAFETAFILKAIENVGLAILVLSLILGAGMALRARSRGE